MTSRLSKLLLPLLTLPLVIYLSICGYMYGQQRQMIYQGSSTRVSVEQTNFLLQRPDTLLLGWQVQPLTAAKGAVIYFGGNAENIERRLPLLAAALPCSDIYMLAYRGYGASSGEPTEALLEADSMALFD